jgi:hypothetical protein
MIGEEAGMVTGFRVVESHESKMTRRKVRNAGHQHEGQSLDGFFTVVLRDRVLAQCQPKPERNAYARRTQQTYIRV